MSGKTRLHGVGTFFALKNRGRIGNRRGIEETFFPVTPRRTAEPVESETVAMKTLPKARRKSVTPPPNVDPGVMADLLFPVVVEIEWLGTPDARHLAETDPPQHSRTANDRRAVSALRLA